MYLPPFPRDPLAHYNTPSPPEIPSLELARRPAPPPLPSAPPPPPPRLRRPDRQARLKRADLLLKQGEFAAARADYTILVRRRPRIYVSMVLSLCVFGPCRPDCGHCVTRQAADPKAAGQVAAADTAAAQYANLQALAAAGDHGRAIEVATQLIEVRTVVPHLARSPSASAPAQPRCHVCSVADGAQQRRRASAARQGLRSHGPARGGHRRLPVSGLACPTTHSVT